MSNMSYCRFENTLKDLRDCQDHFADEDLSATESLKRDDLLRLCREIVEENQE